MSETLDGPARAIAIPFGTRIVTSRSLYSTRHEADGTMHIDAERMAISELVRILTVNLYPRAVVDKTGLTGLYAFKIHWTVLSPSS